MSKNEKLIRDSKYRLYRIMCMCWQLQYAMTIGPLSFGHSGYAVICREVKNTDSGDGVAIYCENMGNFSLCLDIAHKMLHDRLKKV